MVIFIIVTIMMILSMIVESVSANPYNQEEQAAELPYAHVTCIRAKPLEYTAATGDWIFWQGTWGHPDHDWETLQYIHDNIVHWLTVDGRSVDIELSEVYEYPEILYPIFDVNYVSHPLPPGEHHFVYHYELEGYFGPRDVISIVTVIPRG